MTQPPDDLFGATATDPLDEQASALLDAGRAPDEPGIEPALAARLRAMTAARLAVRTVPAAAAARREAALVAALAAFDTAGTDAPNATELPPGGTSLRPSGPASGVAAARAARRWAPQRLLAIAAALAVFAGGAFVVGHLGTGSSKSSSAGSFGAAGGATTAAAASGLAGDQSQAKAAATGAATTAAAAASTAAPASAGGAAATTAAAAPAIAPSPSAADAAALPSFGAVDDVNTLRRKLDAILSLPAAPTSAPGTGPPVSTSAPTRPGQTDGSAFTITRGADCSNRGTVLATLTWQGTPAFVVTDANGVAVLAATDCHELART